MLGGEGWGARRGGGVALGGAELVPEVGEGRAEEGAAVGDEVGVDDAVGVGEALVLLAVADGAGAGNVAEPAGAAGGDAVRAGLR